MNFNSSISFFNTVNDKLFSNSANTINSQSQPTSQTFQAAGTKGLEILAKGYNLHSMTESERIEFANKAVSHGDISLKEAGALLPPRIKKTEFEGEHIIEQVSYPSNYRFDVIEELKNSIEFSKLNGGSKGIEIREALLSKLEHLSEANSIHLHV